MNDVTKQLQAPLDDDYNPFVCETCGGDAGFCPCPVDLSKLEYAKPGDPPRSQDDPDWPHKVYDVEYGD